MRNALDSLSHTVSLGLPWLNPEKNLNLRSPDAWKILFWDHLLHIMCKNKGAILLVLEMPEAFKLDGI